MCWDRSQLLYMIDAEEPYCDNRSDLFATHIINGQDPIDQGNTIVDLLRLRGMPSHDMEIPPAMRHASMRAIFALRDVDSLAR